MRWAYIAMVRPMLSYGCMIWANRTNSRAIEKELTKLDRMAMLTFTRVHKSTPTRGLAVLYNVMPLKNFLEFTGLKSFLRQREQFKETWNGDTGVKKCKLGHRKFWAQKTENLTFLEENYDNCLAPNGANRFHIILDSLNGEKKFRKQYEYNIYTEGSKSGDKTGIGAVIIKDDKVIGTLSQGISSQATIFQAEIKAIGEAAKMMRSMRLENPPKKIKIFTDSQAALLALAADDITSTTVLKAIKDLNDLGNICDEIKLVWIKAHVGHIGNELADKLAKEGSSKENKIQIDTPFIAFKNKLKEIYQEKWDKEWLEYGAARQTKQFFPQGCGSRSKELCKLSRIKLGTAVRVVTGHNNLNYHMSKMVPGHGNICRFCNTELETFFHFITDCDRFEVWRWEILGKAKLSQTETAELNISKIMEFVEHNDIMEALTNFGEREGWEPQDNGEFSRINNSLVNISDVSE
jgi:ribonuclease HI